MHKKLKDTLYFCLGLLLLGLILEIVCLIVNNEWLFPNLWDIIKNTFILLGEKTTYVGMLKTTIHLVLSIIFSLLIGAVLGTLSARFTNIYTILKPTMSLFRTLPMIILIIVLMLVVGFDNAPIYATTIVLIPVFYESFYQGIYKLDRSYIDVYKMESNLTPRVLIRVHFPLISAHIFSALNNSIGMGIKVLVTTEYIAGVSNTLGELVHTSWNNFDYAYIFGYSVIMILLVVALEGIPKGLISLYKYFKYK